VVRLTLTGGTERTVGYGHTVRGTQTAETPALHTALGAFAEGDARDVNKLANNEVVSGEFSADFQQVLFVNAEFSELDLRLNLRFREVAAGRLADAAGFLLPAPSCTDV